MTSQIHTDATRPQPAARVDRDALEVLLVGGAVRDHLLQLSRAGDRDWVVLGETPESMRRRGFLPVGRDFPVFIEPDSGEEYALARTERKSGRGYAGFVFHADAEVTLEQDLSRRDLTINAIAQRPDGSLVDPFGGHQDLLERRLRHVSPAFVEDPVRLLRVARLAARLAPLGFTLAAETLELMHRMVRNGEVDHLVAERVWQELRKALTEPRPSAFLHVLRACGALARVFPEVDALYGVPQRDDYHPEVDCGVHLEMVLDAAAALAPGDELVGWLCLTHDLGKALTPEHVLPSHRGHEDGGIPAVLALSRRLVVPAEYRDLAVVNCREHLNVHRAMELRASTLIDLFERCDLWRRPERLQPLLLACEADSRGRLAREDQAYPQRAWLSEAHAAAAGIRARDLPIAGLDGPQIATLLRKARIAAVRRFKAGEGSPAADQDSAETDPVACG